MNFNFKNISQSNKRIRLIPKNGASISANIGVDNPTTSIDENGVFSVCLAPKNDCEPSTFDVPELNEYGWGNSSNGITYTVNNSEKKVVVFGSTGTTFSLTQSFENAVLYSNLTEPFTHNGYSFDEYFNLNTSGSVLQIKGNSDDSIKDPITVRFYPLIPTDDAPYNIDMYWDIWKAIKGLSATDSIPSIIEYEAEFIELHSCGRL